MNTSFFDADQDQYDLPDAQAGFFELGMDSIMTVELYNRLTELLGVNLPATLVFDFPNVEQLTEYLATEVLQLKAEEEEVITPQNSQLNEAIAIVGMGCHFPGGVTNPEQFWDLLQRGGNSRSEVPGDRWDLDTYYDADPDAPSKVLTRYGHFVGEVDQFDPAFFGISPREATAMDPQHRLLLAVGWQALERAGLAVERLAGAPIGVFVGTNAHDYEELLQQHLGEDPDSPLKNYASIGVHPSSAAGRLAYTFGFTGPAVTLDTACSASLVAIHQACNSLRLGECDVALTGGVLLNLTQTTYIATSQAKMLSPDGQCKAFDAAADGYGRGEGCGMIVLKLLSQAQKDGDQILAVIRGTAVNQDGPSSALTVPNGQAQQQLIKRAIAQAKVSPAEISYLEAHGTGTSLGDPIELNAATAVLGKERSPEQPLWVGSVKTNIGHLEAAAGISGLIKIILSMQHQQIPPHLHLKEPNPKINWQPWFQVPQSLTPWDVPGKRLAGVSSFGFTGTNAHVIVEEAPVTEASPTSTVERPWHCLKLSAKDDKALRELAQKYSDFLVGAAETDLANICFSANVGRLSYRHRLSLAASTKAEFQENLAAFAKGAGAIALSSGVVGSGETPKIAALFTGQGSQYVGMGRELYATQPTFKRAMDRCAEILATYLERPLLEVLYGENADETLLAQTAYTQPALFAIEYALYQLWQSWGIQANAVMGHSVGEYVAACVAGVFSLEDGLKLIAHRGRLMQQLPAGGTMVSLLASVETVRDYLTDYPDVAIAAMNAPEGTVISGSAASMQALVEKFAAAGIKHKTLQVSHAFHSPLMEPMVAEFQAIAQEITYAVPQITFISNVTGKVVTTEVTTAQYWCDHVLAPVNFVAGMAAIAQQGCQIFLECGAKPILLGMGQQCVAVKDSAWLPSLRAEQPDWQQLLSSLGELYVRGIAIDWQGFDRDYPHRRKVTFSLPTYPFQNERYWVETQPLQPKTQATVTPSSTIVELLEAGNVQALISQLQGGSPFSENLTPTQVIEQLIRLHRGEQQTDNAPGAIADLLFKVQWQSQPALTPAVLPPGQWLLLADQQGLAIGVANLLQTQNHQCFIIPHSTEADTLFDLEVRINELAQHQTRPFYGVIALNGWERNGENIAPEWDWEESLRPKITPLITAVQKFSHLLGTPPKIWIVTCQAQGINNGIKLAQVPLWGLGRTIALEYPNLWGGLIDLDEAASLSQAAQQITAEILQTQPVNQVAYRETTRYLPQLGRSPQTQSLKLSPDHSYLISGGLGDLGLRVAQTLVSQGARHLVLLSRRGVTQDSQQAVIDHLVAAGAKVQAIAADVSNWSAMIQAWATITETMPPLRGIIHAAGVLADGLLQNQNWADFAKVMEPKVQGAWYLHRLSQAQKLDFFVCFSSATSILGSPAQANYATANAFLDGLCAYRNQLGLSALSINWGPWADVGMAATLATRLEQVGWKLIPPSQALEALVQLLGSQGQMGVIDFTWENLQQHLLDEVKPFFAQVMPAALAQRVTPKAEAIALAVDRPIFEQLLQVDAPDREALLRVYLQQNVGKVLGLKVNQLPPVDQDLLGMGMDSLMIMQVLNQLKQDLKLMVYPREFYERPRIDELATYFANEFIEMHGDQAIATPPSPVIPITNKIPENIFEELTALDSTAKTTLLTGYLQQNIGKVLGLKANQLPPVDQDLLGMGMDSLMIMQVLNQLKQDLKLMVYPREFYERPRIDELAVYFAEEFTQMHGNQAIANSTSSSTPVSSTPTTASTGIRRPDQEPLPRSVFVLSPPRAGSTLLRVMLAGHPDLFSPPELHLLPYRSMAEWSQALEGTYFQEGLQKALMELMGLDAAASAALLTQLETENRSIYDVYALLQKHTGDRLLVDKSPTYALEPSTLQRAEEIFQGAKYVHLTRHPYAMIESFAKLRMDKLLGINHGDPYQAAEQIWLKSNRNILDFAEQTGGDRYHLLRYEDLVQQPEAQLRSLCDFLGVAFLPALLNPYEGDRMTDGVYQTSASIGDPNFANHRGIDASLADTWRNIQLPHVLTAETQAIATKLGYELPNELPQATATQNNTQADEWEEIEL
jgi:acyl transferase domain-containing protein/acyl carrier protein